MNFNPHPFTLRQLQYAVAVADALSFRKAAERCHVSQPSLSAQLAQLEDALGLKLFERDRRRVLPTPAGKEVLERARRLLMDADDLAGRGASGPAIRWQEPSAWGSSPRSRPICCPVRRPRSTRPIPASTILWVEDKTDTLLRSLEAGRLDAAAARAGGGGRRRGARAGGEGSLRARDAAGTSARGRRLEGGAW